MMIKVASVCESASDASVQPIFRDGRDLLNPQPQRDGNAIWPRSVPGGPYRPSGGESNSVLFVLRGFGCGRFGDSKGALDDRRDLANTSRRTVARIEAMERKQTMNDAKK
jgi:hypothetical protein